MSQQMWSYCAKNQINGEKKQNNKNSLKNRKPPIASGHPVAGAPSATRLPDCPGPDGSTSTRRPTRPHVGPRTDPPHGPTPAQDPFTPPIKRWSFLYKNSSRSCPVHRQPSLLSWAPLERVAEHPCCWPCLLNSELAAYLHFTSPRSLAYWESGSVVVTSNFALSLFRVVK